MKFKKLESDPETWVTFGSLSKGTAFVFVADEKELRVYIKTPKIRQDREGWDCNSVCLFDTDYHFINDNEPVKIVECILEYKVVR